MKMAAASLLVLLTLVVVAWVAVAGFGGSVKIDWGSNNFVANTSGEVDKDAVIEGVLIINDDVYIDGAKIDRGVGEYFSKKTRKTYSIRWGKKGEGASVTEKTE
ncbi:hypothetical protein [Accumulibacter sp.]|uniref:hypothetical protein n=1 Tax=Accumulibacter sp. TaxID=2053492 RepID=UPI002616F222|nr:hypothetical protein [Accumulibacter sp.]